jgi:vancomycin aglycone glucosyltransferase
MKIALAAVGTSGDVRPIIALGLKLRARGDNVVIGAPPNFEAHVRRCGLSFHPVGIDVQADVAESAARFMGKPFRALQYTVTAELAMLPSQHACLLEAAKGCDRLLCGGYLFVGPTVAEILGIPYAHVFHVPQVLKSSCHPPVQTPWLNLPRIGNRMSWIGYTTIMDRVFGRVINEFRRKAGLKKMENPDLFGLNKMILAMDGELSPVPPDVREVVIQTGYWNFFEGEALPRDLEAFIEAGSAPVYVGFGSMTDPAPAATLNAVKEALDLVDGRAIAAKEYAAAAGEFPKDRIFFTGPVPHWTLFPRMKAIVHHGGAGTTWASCRAGVPQVIAPQWGDQYYWADRVYRLKLGSAPINRSNLTGKRLAAALGKATEDADIKRNCGEMGKKLKARDGLAEAVERFDSLF